jgi:hypothetical protein
MTVGQYLTHFATPNRPNYEKMKDFRASRKEYEKLLKSDEPTTIIFPQRKLLTGIFGNKGINIEQHKHLAHVRRINTTGMPDASVDDVGTFSVIISHRTGKLLSIILLYANRKFGAVSSVITSKQVARHDDC